MSSSTGAKVLDCRSVAKDFRRWIMEAKAGLSKPPCLATVLFQPTRHPASVSYRDLILKDAQVLGLEARSLEPQSRERLVDTIEGLNKDPEVTGVMVFYPLGGGLVDDDFMDLVSPDKDVEGLHSLNLGYLIKFKRFLDSSRQAKCVVPATAKAVVKTLQSEDSIRLEGSFVTVINNSMRVGKPLGLMLENLGATVVKCYDKTRPAVIADCVRRSDIVITAVPDPAFRVDPAWIKPGTSVVDVSYEGNVDADKLANAAFITVPDNRVGQVTRAMMFVNLIYCARAAERRGA
jgi:5,10-methylene-tetrahydrofolate dehydrogenase/methenyl tetrahydrofolate cyclohydrolase